MKRIIGLMALIAMMLCFSVASKAQNVQIFYDTERDFVTSTLEMFRPDAFGSTFYFVDMDYTPNAIGAYVEFAREFCFWQDSKYNWLSIHAEYNGELTSYKAEGSDYAVPFNNAWLAGLPTRDIRPIFQRHGHSRQCTRLSPTLKKMARTE